MSPPYSAAEDTLETAIDLLGSIYSDLPSKSPEADCIRYALSATHDALSHLLAASDETGTP